VAIESFSCIRNNGGILWRAAYVKIDIVRLYSECCIRSVLGKKFLSDIIMWF